MFTIVTVTYNAESSLKKTIESVLVQNFQNFEYLILDGLSTDKTVEIAKSYISKFDERKISYQIISQKDEGIYDAMNKGVLSASGDWIYFLNAGDALYSKDILSKIYDVIEKNQDISVVYGDYLSLKRGKEILLHSKEVDNLPQQMICSHQCVLFKIEVQKKFLYDLKYRICADYNCLFKIYNAGYKFIKINDIIVIYPMDGISNTQLAKTYEDVINVRIENGALEKWTVKMILKKKWLKIKSLIKYLLKC